jgi:hypothetical protein
MKFLWFGKKKSAASAATEATPVESISVNNFLVVPAPLGESSSTALSASVIHSYLAALIRADKSEKSLALEEFLQERGMEPLEITHYSHSLTQGYSCKIASTGATVLLGAPDVIARATTPFHSEISEAIKSGADQVLAIDGIAYAAYSIDK